MFAYPANIFYQTLDRQNLVGAQLVLVLLRRADRLMQAADFGGTTQKRCNKLLIGRYPLLPDMVKSRLIELLRQVQRL